MNVIQQKRKIFKTFASTDHLIIAKLPMLIANKKILFAKSEEAKKRLVRLALYALEQDRVLSLLPKKSLWNNITNILGLAKNKEIKMSNTELDITGLDEVAAIEILHKNGIDEIRILEKNGEVLLGTMDVVDNRINLYLNKDGKVYKTSKG